MRNTIRSLWENTAVRYSVLLIALGYCPFVFLSYAYSALNATTGGQ